MKVILIEEEAFYTLIEEVYRRLHGKPYISGNKPPTADGNEWLTLEEAQKILPFKSKTSWQKMRDQGKIKFSQFGRKILYSRKSLMEYLTKNEVK